MVVGLSQLPARRRGTHCQHTFVVWRTAPLHLDDHLRLICFLSTSVYGALGISAIMRYINRRFTYLLTSLSDKPTKVSRTFTGIQEQSGQDALPAVTNEITWVPAGVEPRLAGCTSVAFTTEPRLLVQQKPWLLKENFYTS